jgi:hypothetical protein
VPRSLRLPVELLDRRYDKYRDAIAAVEDASGNAVGYLVTYAREQARFEGFSRLRPKWRPTERIVGWFVPTQGRADEEYLEIDDLESGTWGPDKLRWLQGSERDAAWRRYLDEWGPHDDASRLADNRDEPVVSPSLDRDAAREPGPLYLVFETGGHAHAFETLEDAGDSLEALDLKEGHYIGAFSDQGEVITMSPGGLWITFHPSGTFDKTALQTLIRGSRTFSELAEDPHRFARAIWQSN